MTAARRIAAVTRTAPSRSTPVDVAAVADDPVLLEVLLRGLDATQAGLCLCDPLDDIRFANASFRAAFFPDLETADPVNFADAVADAMRKGHGIKLVSMPLETFIPHIKQRRLRPDATATFSVDTCDGRWWWVSDHKLADGWMLIIANEMSALKKEEELLRDAHASALHAAQTDYLTGIANRRFGFERAAVALETCRREAVPIAVALVDIDHFKQVNDLRGHEVGDKVLVHIAAWFAGGIRPQDMVSRIGGEEFLLVWPATDEAAASALLERLLTGIPPMALVGCAPVVVTASAGLATARPTETFDQMLVRADGALYEAKQNGRNRIARSRR